ncbi:MAG: hypothetical protein OHK0053_35060 [Microscillaceae bacterium]
MKSFITSIFLKGIISSLLLLHGFLAQAQEKPSAEALLQQALAQCAQIYAQTTQEKHFIYRETVAQNRQYAQLTEATGNLRYQPYQASFDYRQAYKQYHQGTLYNTSFLDTRRHRVLTHPDDQARIYEARSCEANFQPGTAIQLKGGPLGLTAYDLVKYPAVFMEKGSKAMPTPSLSPSYQFRLLGEGLQKDRICYEIEFLPYPTLRKEALFAGKIYLDKESLAIVRVNYQQIADEQQDVQVYAGEKFIYQGHQVNVCYQPLENGQWTLSQIEVRDQIQWQPNARPATWLTYQNESAIWLQPEAETVSSSLSGHIVPNQRDLGLASQIGDYHPLYWQALQNQALYPSLPVAVKADLEKKTSLERQFMGQTEALSARSLQK